MTALEYVLKRAKTDRIFIMFWYVGTTTFSSFVVYTNLIHHFYFVDMLCATVAFCNIICGVSAFVLAMQTRYRTEIRIVLIKFILTVVAIDLFVFQGLTLGYNTAQIVSEAVALLVIGWIQIYRLFNLRQYTQLIDRLKRE
jgi:hypothetical protein